MRPFFGYRSDLEPRPLLMALPPLPVLAFTPPPKLDPRPWLRIENQLQIGSCQGNSRTTVSELAYHIQTKGQIAQFSRRFAYLTSQMIDKIIGTDCGSTLDGGWRAAHQYGECPEDVFPYWQPGEDYSPDIPREAFTSATPFKIEKRYNCRSYDDVFRFLASGQGGVQIGIAWPDSYMDCSGLIESYPADGVGGHAVCFVGYTERKDRQGRNYLLLPNSWDTEWGNGGWAEVAPQAVEQMARHPETVMIGYSDLTIPEVRKVDWSGSFSG